MPPEDKNATSALKKILAWWRASRHNKLTALSAAVCVVVGLSLVLVLSLKPEPGKTGRVKVPFAANLPSATTPDMTSPQTSAPDSQTSGSAPGSTGSGGKKSTSGGGSSTGGDSSSSGGSSSSGSCSGAANHVAGGKDGTGSCWPGPNNTGIPAGTQLSNYSGPCTISSANVTIDSKTVNCDLSIQAANFTLKNSKVNGTVILDVDRPGSGSWSMTIQDSEVDAGTQQLSAIGWGNFTVLRSNVHGGQTSVQCEENSVHCLIQDSYLHGQYLPDDQPWHLGGFLSDGTQNLTIKHNYVVCDHPINSLAEGCTGDINLIPNFAAINGALIEHNLLGASTGLSYCTYGGEKSSSSTPHSFNVVYKDNIFQRGSNGKCGEYGPVTNFDINQSGNQWINNRWADGGVVDPEN